MFDNIDVPGMDAYDFAESVQNRPTPLLEGWGAAAAESWNNNLITQGYQWLSEHPEYQTPEMRALTPGLNVMTESQWRSSSFFRDGLPFEEGLTQRGWELRADRFDEKQFRDWQNRNRQGGVFDATGGFISALAAGAVDPINYIPIAGPAFRAAMVVRMGRTAGRIFTSALEAGVATAAAEPFLLSRRRTYGEDVDYADGLLDVAMGALTGGAIAASSPLAKAIYRAAKGPLARAGERFNLISQQPASVERRALATLDRAIADLANGRRIDVGPESVETMRLMSRLTRGPESIKAELEARFKERGINAEVILPPGASPYPEASGSKRPAAARSPGTGRPPPPAPRVTATPESVQAATGLPLEQAAELADQVNRETAMSAPDGSPAGRVGLAKEIKRKLERNAVERETAAVARIETLRAQMRELNQLPDGPEKDAQLSALREQIESERATVQEARRQLREGVPMPTDAELDVMLTGDAAARAGLESMPQIDRVKTVVGDAHPWEIAPRDVDAVEREPVETLEESTGVNPETGDFDELPLFLAAQRQGLYSAENIAAWKATDAEFQQSKFYVAAHQVAAVCLAE